MRFPRRKKHMILLSLLCLSAGLFALSGCGRGVGESGPDKAWDMVKALNPGWNLGNSLEIQNLDYGFVGKDAYDAPDFEAVETLLGNPVTGKSLFQALADRGFKAVRIPVSFYNHLIESQPQETLSDGSTLYHPGETIDPDWLARIKELVDWALEAGLYVVINDHHDTSMWMNISWIYAEKQELEAQLAPFVNIWTQYAAYFKDYDSRLLFQSTGEIVNKRRSFEASDWRDFRTAHDFNQAFIDAVRATGGENTRRFLILPTYAANAGILFVDESFYIPYTDNVDDKLIFSVHSYATDPQELAWCFQTLYGRAQAYGLPFVVDECGPMVNDPPDVRIGSCYALAYEAERYEAAVFLWDAGVGEIGFVDRLKTMETGTLAYVEGYDYNGERFAVDSAAAVEALFRGKAEAPPLTEEEKADLLSGEIKTVPFAYLDKKGAESENEYGFYLRSGSYTETNEEAARPETIYAPAPKNYACLYPYVQVKGLKLQARLPENMRVVFRELDEKGRFLRQKYITASGGWYVASEDAYLAAVYFRDDTGSRSFEDYIAAVKSGELALYAPEE